MLIGSPATFAAAPAADVADALVWAIHAPEEPGTHLGASQSALDGILHRHHLIWAPDGDAAFDDGDHVVQFDAGDRVRLIAFPTTRDFRHDPATLAEQWLPAEEFYAVLEEWRRAFLSEWERAEKVAEADEAAP